MTYDEAGNLLTVQAPGMTESKAVYDARGLATSERRPDGSTITRTYDALGNLTEYRDEAGRETNYATTASVARSVSSIRMERLRGRSTRRTAER